MPLYAKEKEIGFSNPSEVCKTLNSVSALDVPDTLSWNDEERDLSTWLGNPMQREAFNKLYSVADRIRIAQDPRISQDWDYLQASNNFKAMSTKPSHVGMYRGIYNDAFDAFTNYMNVLGDFLNRVDALYPAEIDNDELNSLLTTIRNQGEEIEIKDKEIARLKNKVDKLEGKVSKATTTKVKTTKSRVRKAKIE